MIKRKHASPMSTQSDSLPKQISNSQPANSRATRRTASHKLLLRTIIPIVVLYFVLLGNLKWQTKPSQRFEVRADEPPKEKVLENTKFHLVFSTGCSLWQDWQSLVFFYHVKKVGQVGNVTRIISGCDPAQTHQLETFHRQYIQNTLSSNFYLHFTPDFSTVVPNVEYVYFNKPFGLKHWMEKKLGYSSSKSVTNNTHDEDVIFLLDPDQILLRPLTNDYSDTDMRWVDRPNMGFSKRIQHETTFAQQYAFGNNWITRVNLTHVMTHFANDEYSPSLLWKIKAKSAKRFAAGPPYIATAKDMYRIVTYWANFVPLVYESFPNLLAEMYAYSLAAMHVHRRPFTALGFMVSITNQYHVKEGWYWIEEQQPSPSIRSVCTKSSMSKGESVPFLLHYCQLYNLGHAFFVKYWVPNNFTHCGSPLLSEPSPKDLVNFDYGINPKTRELIEFENTTITKQKRALREAWILCTLMPAINEAIAFFKHQYCPKNAYINLQKVGITGDINTWLTSMVG